MTHRTTDRPVIHPADLALLGEAVGLIRSARIEDILADLLPTVGPRELVDLARHCELIHAAVPLFLAVQVARSDTVVPHGLRARCAQLLRACVAPMPSHAELLLVERLLPDGDVAPPGTGGSPAVLWDVHMLCNVGGRARRRPADGSPETGL
ncbi:hypothetical protein ACPC54_38655 [Kitasatospora sp. NPDC094028]